MLLLKLWSITYSCTKLGENVLGLQCVKKKPYVIDILPGSTQTGSRNKSKIALLNENTSSITIG